jgi:hypothetical protein
MSLAVTNRGRRIPAGATVVPTADPGRWQQKRRRAGNIPTRRAKIGALEATPFS